MTFLKILRPKNRTLSRFLNRGLFGSGSIDSLTSSLYFRKNVKEKMMTQTKKKKSMMSMRCDPRSDSLERSESD